MENCEHEGRTFLRPCPVCAVNDYWAKATSVLPGMDNPRSPQDLMDVAAKLARLEQENQEMRNELALLECRQISESHEQLRARIKEFERLQEVWLMSPEAAQRLEGYRKLADRCAALEAERDAAVAKEADTWANWESRVGALKEQIRELSTMNKVANARETKIATLRTALLKYAAHAPNCFSAIDCTCGLSVVLLENKP